MFFTSSIELDVKEDTQRMYYYDEEDYDDDQYIYSNDYLKEDDAAANFLQFPFANPPQTSRPTTTTTTTTTTTITTTEIEKTTQSIMKSTSGRKSYSPGGYKRYNSQKATETQSPRSYGSGSNKSPIKANDIACNSPQMLKQFLKSGAHGNDPRKIKAMIEKCQLDRDKAANNELGATTVEDDEDTNAQSIFEKYAINKKSSNTKNEKNTPNKGQMSSETSNDLPAKSFLPPGYKGFESTKSISDEEEEYEDDEEYYDDEDYGSSDIDTKDEFKPYGGIVRPPKISTSSNLFRKFIKQNAGKTVRRPTNNNDEESKAVSDIFKKYSSGNFQRPKGSYNKV